VVAAVLLTAFAAGCGADGGGADLVNGKQLFIGEGTCANCHALKRADATGSAGPDLDQAFINSRENGFGDSVIEGVVREQIAHPRRFSMMKPDLVKGDDARDVAAYVAEVAGKPGEDTGVLASVQAEDYSKQTAVAKGGTLEIPAAPQGLQFQFGMATAKPGPIEITMPNPSSDDHNIALEGGPTGPVVGADGVSTISANLKPGEIEYLCTVPGHAEGGMRGTLTVK
jgi:mono/diheme cytochrome c family protein